MADMREGSSIQATVALGQKLASLLRTLVELNPSSHSGMKDVHYDVEATSSTLRQLQDMHVIGFDGKIVSEPDTKSAVTSASLEAVENLAVKCGLIYKSIILVIQKAGVRGKSNEGDDEASSLENLKNELLTGPMPDLSSIKSIKLLRVPEKYEQREWLDPRFERLEEQLQWIRTGLLIHLHISKLAQLQNGSVERNTGAFENELMYRSSIQLLRRRQVKFTKKKAKKQEKAQRQWELQRQVDKSETASVTSVASSVSSAVTTSTVVDNETSPNDGTMMAKGVGESLDSDHVGSVLANKVEQGGAIDGKQDDPKQLTNDNVTAVKARIDKSKTPRSLTWDGQWRSNLPAYFFDWKQRVFGTDDKFKTDWPSTSLEAWTYFYAPHGKPSSRVPFGHKRLQYGLNKVIKDGQNGKSTWDRYLEMSRFGRHAMDQIVEEANQKQSRERVCVAFQEYETDQRDSFLLVFMSIRKEPKPISFKDALGRHYTLPFETCRNWDAMKGTLVEAFNHVPVTGPHVIEGHFDLQNSNGDIILPHLWNTTIKPGDGITMRMWPTSVPLAGIYPPPPFVPNPHGYNAGNEAMRMARMRHFQQLRMNAIRQFQGPPGFTGLPPPPGMPPPPPGGSPPRAPMVDIVSMSSRSSEPTYDITEKEDEQLMFIDFVEELEKTNSATLADLFRKFTTLKDVTDEDSLGDLLNADSDYDSDGSTSTSSSSELIND